MSNLEELSESFRKELIIKNIYHDEDNYSSRHLRAISDGDEFGKDPMDNSADSTIGSSIDILSRDKLTVKNHYSFDKEYRFINEGSDMVGGVDGLLNNQINNDARTCLKYNTNNIYTDNCIYSEQHKNAISDGDELGKGGRGINNMELPIGTRADIDARTCNIARNRYVLGDGQDEYSEKHTRAISDDDEFGKGEHERSKCIGSSVDIIQRNLQLNCGNVYSCGNEYNAAHLRAVSNGDEFGKGENKESNSIGSSVDISQRICQLNCGNVYSYGNEYNVSHSRAISDGDEFGKGNIDGGKDIGSSVDIIQRNLQTICGNKYLDMEYGIGNC